MRIWLCSLALLLVLGPAYGGDEEAADPEDPKALLAWADQLDWPDLAKMPFVRVSTGQFNQLARVPKNTFVHGFLQKDNGKRFTIVPLGNPVVGWHSAMHDYKRTADDAPEHARVTYEYLVMPPVAEELLKTFPRAVPAWHEDGQGIRWTPTGVLMFAKALQATDREDLAIQIVRRARFGREGATQNLEEAARDELAHDTHWALVKAFGDTKVSFVQLRDRYRRYLSMFSHRGEQKRVRASLELLEQMVREQTAHDATVKPLEHMSGPDRIAELIFQLRTQHGQQWSQPGACSIWLDERDEQSPAHQLRRIGYPAVPALIDVVDDPRFTRSVGFHRDFYFSHYVLRVGDAANDVLSAITGAAFYHSTTTWGAMVKDGKSSQVKKSWLRWWAEFETKGEKQVLIDSVGATGNSEHARRLLAKYPDAAPPVILAAARKFQKTWPRVELVGVVAKLKGEEATAFLHEELRSGPLLVTRLEAARILHERGVPEAMQAMVAEWTRGGPPEYGRDELTEFLVRGGDPATIATLGRYLANRLPPARIQVVRAFAAVAARLRDGDAEEAFSADARSAVEALLVGRLTDTERWEGCSMSFGRASFQDPRVCDMTAFTLHQIWPDRYPAFDAAASPLQRTRHCIRAANNWRKRQGLELLPMPSSNRPAPLAADVADGLLQRILEARGDASRKEAVDQLAAHGLPALPRVRTAIADARFTPIREPLIALDKRLAAIVAVVTFDPPDRVADHPLRTFVEGLRGKPLEPDAFIEILTRFCSDMPPDTDGLRLGIDREGDGSGITLSLQWMKGGADFEARERGWDYTFHLRAGTELLTGGSGGAAYSYKQDAEGWRDYRDHLADALGSAPGTSIEGYVSIRFSNE